MGDFIVRTGDFIKVTISAPAIVPQLLAPIPLIGTGTTVLVGGKPVCLRGDELPPALLAPMPYTAPPFVTPGMGQLRVILLPNNTTLRTVQGKPMLLKGGAFQAMFQVQVPAMQPTPGGPIPDPIPVKPGTAQFITTNINTQAG